MRRMREIIILFVHLVVTVVRLARPGGLRSVVAESILVKHQLQMLNRGRKRSPNLLATDRNRRRFLRPFHAPGSPPAFRHHPETVNSTPPSERSKETKVSYIVLR